MYLYCLDLWPDSIKDKIKNEKNPIFKVTSIISKMIYSAADMIGVTSKPFVDYLNSVCQISKDKIVFLPQHAQDIGKMDISTIDNGIVDFVFMGNIGSSQDLDKVIEAASLLDNNLKFRIHIVGGGSALNCLKALVRKKDLEDKVIFHGRHPVSDMPQFYRLADACLLTLSSESAVGLTIPGKLQGYMSAGKPIVGAINGPAQEIINEADGGICVSAGDIKGLAQAMEDFIVNQHSYLKCGYNNREYYENNFTKERVVTMLEIKLKELVY